MRLAHQATSNAEDPRDRIPVNSSSSSDPLLLNHDSSSLPADPPAQEASDSGGSDGGGSRRGLISSMENNDRTDDGDILSRFNAKIQRARQTVVTFGKFIGPGFMVAVAYSMARSLDSMSGLREYIAHIG